VIIKQYSKQYWAIKNNYKIKSTKMTKKQLNQIDKAIKTLSALNVEINIIFRDIVIENVSNTSETYIDLGNFEKHEYKKIYEALENLKYEKLQNL